MEPDKSLKPQASLGRREFSRGAIAAVAAAALTPLPALPQRGETSAAGSPPQQQGPDLSDLSAEARAEIDSKVENVIRRWGDRLSDEQKTRMRTIITRHVRMLETVRKFPLKNGDAPASVLKLYTAPQAPVGRSHNQAARPAKQSH